MRNNLLEIILLINISINASKKIIFHFSGAIDALRLLYKYGANQLQVDKDSLTGINRSLINILFNIYFNLALHCAATRGHTSCIRMLVEQCGCPIEG